MQYKAPETPKPAVSQETHTQAVSPFTEAELQGFIKLIDECDFRGLESKLSAAGKCFGPTQTLHGEILCKLAEKKRIKLIDLMLSKGMDVNSVSNNRDTALHVATRCGHFNLVYLLAQQRNAQQLVNSHNETPLQLAIRAPVTGKYKYSNVQKCLIYLLRPPIQPNCDFSLDGEGLSSLSASPINPLVLQDLVRFMPIEYLRAFYAKSVNTFQYFTTHSNDDYKVVTLIARLRLAKNDDEQVKAIRDVGQGLSEEKRNICVAEFCSLSVIKKQNPSDRHFCNNLSGETVLHGAVRGNNAKVVGYIIGNLESTIERLHNPFVVSHLKEQIISSMISLAAENGSLEVLKLFQSEGLLFRYASDESDVKNTLHRSAVFNQFNVLSMIPYLSKPQGALQELFTYNTKGKGKADLLLRGVLEGALFRFNSLAILQGFPVEKMPDISDVRAFIYGEQDDVLAYYLHCKRPSSDEYYDLVKSFIAESYIRSKPRLIAVLVEFLSDRQLADLVGLAYNFDKEEILKVLLGNPQTRNRVSKFTFELLLNIDTPWTAGVLMRVECADIYIEHAQNIYQSSLFSYLDFLIKHRDVRRLNALFKNNKYLKEIQTFDLVHFIVFSRFSAGFVFHNMEAYVECIYQNGIFSWADAYGLTLAHYLCHAAKSGSFNPSFFSKMKMEELAEVWLVRTKLDRLPLDYLGDAVAGKEKKDLEAYNEFVSSVFQMTAKASFERVLGGDRELFESIFRFVSRFNLMPAADQILFFFQDWVVDLIFEPLTRNPIIPSSINFFACIRVGPFKITDPNRILIYNSRFQELFWKVANINEFASDDWFIRTSEVIKQWALIDPVKAYGAYMRFLMGVKIKVDPGYRVIIGFVCKQILNNEGMSNKEKGDLLSQAINCLDEGNHNEQLLELCDKVLSENTYSLEHHRTAFKAKLQVLLRSGDKIELTKFIDKVLSDNGLKEFHSEAAIAMAEQILVSQLIIQDQCYKELLQLYPDHEDEKFDCNQYVLFCHLRCLQALDYLAIAKAKGLSQADKQAVHQLEQKFYAKLTDDASDQLSVSKPKDNLGLSDAAPVASLLICFRTLMKDHPELTACAIQLVRPIKDLKFKAASSVCSLSSAASAAASLSVDSSASSADGPPPAPRYAVSRVKSLRSVSGHMLLPPKTSARQITPCQTSIAPRPQ